MAVSVSTDNQVDFKTKTKQNKKYCQMTFSLVYVTCHIDRPGLFFPIAFSFCHISGYYFFFPLSI
jgi:hypothetical protein